MERMAMRAVYHGWKEGGGGDDMMRGIARATKGMMTVAAPITESFYLILCCVFYRRTRRGGNMKIDQVEYYMMILISLTVSDSMMCSCQLAGSSLGLNIRI
ncbi:hypothetical protein ACHAXS_012382, partial [Conticribra weissflogii]